MQVKIVEHDNSFYLSLTPETVEENIQLLRLSANAKPDSAMVSANFYKGAQKIDSSIRFLKYKDVNSSIINTERRK